MWGNDTPRESSRGTRLQAAFNACALRDATTADGQRPLVDDFLYSLHFSIRQCLDVVRRI